AGFGPGVAKPAFTSEPVHMAAIRAQLAVAQRAARRFEARSRHVRPAGPSPFRADVFGAGHGLEERRGKIRCHQERAGLGSLAIDSATRWPRAGGGPFVAASSRSISSTEENTRVVSCAPVRSIVSCFCSCRSFEGLGSIVQADLWKWA